MPCKKSSNTALSAPQMPRMFRCDSREGMKALRVIRIIGVGNEARGDDGVGLIIARVLRDRHPPDAIVSEHSGEGTSLLECWRADDAIIFIDAMASDAVAGTIRRIDARAGRMPEQAFSYSSHAFGVAEAIELARALDSLPAALIVYGIEGQQFTPGAGLSGSVRRAIPEAIASVLCEVARISQGASGSSALS
jgi:hydrogenase maturation protease